MLVNCNSCQKKFVVPDGAITESGRLVQCGSCGNKWTQYPIEDIKIKEKIFEKIKLEKKITVVKKSKPKKNLYTPEYLQKKHGLIINESSGATNKKKSESSRQKNRLGFYSYVIILFVLFSSLFGLLELTKEIIILKYPVAETYIVYFYEVIDILKISLSEFADQFNK
jgi:predicted Zn finger-like uncharacterized protein